MKEAAPEYWARSQIVKEANLDTFATAIKETPPW